MTDLVAEFFARCGEARAFEDSYLRRRERQVVDDNRGFMSRVRHQTPEGVVRTHHAFTSFFRCACGARIKWEPGLHEVECPCGTRHVKEDRT